MIWWLIAYVIGAVFVAIGVSADDGAKPAHVALLVFGWPIVFSVLFFAAIVKAVMIELFRIKPDEQ